MQEELIYCPKCGHGNSESARRCANKINNKRCDFFFLSKRCENLFNSLTGKLIKTGCGSENDIVSKTCRECGGYMSDPNERLSGTHYTQDDFIDVLGFAFGLTRDKTKLVAQYRLANNQTAREVFDISSRQNWQRVRWYEFIAKHVKDKASIKIMKSAKSPVKLSEYFNDVIAPKKITHRKNKKGFDIISKKEF